MKRLSVGILLSVCVLCGCASAPPPEPAPPDELTIRQVLEIPGVSKNELFERAKTWVGQSFSNSLDVIQSANRTRGTVIGKTYISHSRPARFGQKDFFELRFTLMVEAKDNKIRTTFTDMRLMNQFGVQTILKTDMEELRPRLEEAVKSLVASFNTEKTDENW
ncbi:DUF4468 domain-containing protein [Desulfonema ishimotonii]|uniref:DUF4468 domain-containing protein n=2 Tax=Desulfonema ishimotonii TaxID=45657 RepID=A0A401G484_9BACT|nr:DUF4468 domain-containing protein [Desulfonema ishimotonii]